ncbi:AAA family ATPase [Brevundimonas sp. SL130]|uniref:AAA family ATPase n=1 Tax=Brevundimonas sp. SL130 TaxID=2995143 RepID=UPI00226C655E|nr:AAA family ATPase [Brevundimonas sp. SL130]WAC59648.1 AAA family ATPase [Brevundimonas sp. SL130]
MKFELIELENIFAYRGRSEIRLSDCTPEKNIVVVQGRNGHGKTSLLNAMKLLFVGTDDPRMLRVGFGEATPLTPKAFVTGQQGRWFGVFNILARATEEPARVALSWTSDDEQACRAERVYFPLKGGTDYKEQVTVVLGHRRLEGVEAKQYLQAWAPREILSFFFFDGEQIQSLADAEVGRERAEIERLLGLYFVSHLTREIDVYGRERRKVGIPETVRTQIAQAEGAERTARLTGDAAQRQRIEFEEEVADLDRTRLRLEIERAALRNGLSEEERRRLEDRITLLKEEQARLSYQIASTLPVEAPAIANLAMARRAFDLLEAQLEGGADVDVATRVHRTAPDAVVSALMDVDPSLVADEPRKAIVRDAVRRGLTEGGLDDGRPENPLFASLSPRKLRALRDRFLVWSQTGDTIVASQASLLQRMRQLTHDQTSLERELEESDITSEESRERYAELTVELEGLETVIRDRVGQIATLTLDETKARREQAQHADDVKRLYERFDHVVKLNAAYQTAVRTKRALESYKDERRRQIRASVEARLQAKVAILLGPTQLVKSVRLDEQFGMTYIDEFGDPVARYSLSAGMRQLAAMSMLWALKEETKLPLPVIIDTPLGRIDRENREILMSDYFPEAGMPLVVLPTNSELTEDDFARLNSRIARRYEIRNDGSVSARIEDVTRQRRTGSDHG